MPCYRYLAFATDGAAVRGCESAASERDLWDRLAAERLEVESIRRVWYAPELRLPKRAIPERQVELFTRLLSSLVRSLTTVQALDVLESQLPWPRLREVARALRTEVRKGAPLHQSLRQHSGAFGATYCAVVEQGERSGTLDRMLAHLAYTLEHTGKIRAEFWKALSYPLVVLGTVLAMAVYVLTSVLPEFAAVYRQHQLELPPITVALLGASTLLARYATLLGTGTAVALVAAARLLRREPVRLRTDALLLRTPLLGPLLQRAAMAAFCHYMAVLLDSGVVVVQALRLTAETVPNRALRAALREAAGEVAAGRGLAAALQRSGQVPPMVSSVVAVGERGGDLPEMLSHLARTYEDQVLRDVQLLARVTEPLLILLLTVIVGVLVGAIYSPIMKAFSAFSIQ